MRTEAAERGAPGTGPGKQVRNGSPTSRLESIYISLSTWRAWYWVGVPLLAILACATVLRVGFLADDYTLLAQARSGSEGLGVFLPSPQWIFYRPVGTLLTWQLGWLLWGYDPLPYHIVGLLLHAGAVLALGLWASELTGRGWLGWLAGALFAVFPGHLEAVAWVAAQWDLWAALFAFLGLWLFTGWWRRGGANRYLPSMLLFGLSVFSKESVLTFLPVFALSAWYLMPRNKWSEWRRLGLALLPFGALLALNISVRYLSWGDLRGYEGAPGDYVKFFWDKLISYAHLLLAPVNTAVAGAGTQQVVGALTSIFLLVLLAAYGREQLRLLAIALAWLLLTLAPVLNLNVQTNDLYGNRYIYLPAAGYCLGVAALLYAFAVSVSKHSLRAIASIAALLVAGVVLCWLQLRPWHTATVLVNELESEAARLVPSQPRPQGMTWYVQDLPYSYRGAEFLPQGFGASRLFTGAGDVPFNRFVDDATTTSLVEDASDAFALRVRYLSQLDRYVVDYAAGVTGPNPAPSGALLGEGAQVWDFSGCAADVVSSWQVVNAGLECQPGSGLSLATSNADTQLVLPSIEFNTSNASWVRLRVATTYPLSAQDGELVYQWYWRTPGADWNETDNRTMPLKADDRQHVYWAFIPTSEVGASLTGLRFDPVNAQIPVQVEWVALDLVR